MRDKNLHVLIHPALSLATIKREVQLISQAGDDISIVSHGGGDGVLDAYMLAKSDNIISCHIIKNSDVPLSARGRGVLLHGHITADNLKNYVVDFLKGYHVEHNVLYMANVEADVVEEEVIEDEVVESVIEDELVEDELVEDELVEDEVEDELVEDEVEDELVEDEDVEEDLDEEDSTEDNLSDGSDSDDRPDSRMWDN